MSRLPYFKFEVASWLTSPTVICMKAYERGAFIQLLAIQWFDDDCGIPADEDEIRAVAGLSESEWAASRSKLLKQFPEHPTVEGKRANKKLLGLMAEAEADCEQKRIAGSLGGKQKAINAMAKSSTAIAPLQQKSSAALAKPSYREGEGEGDKEKELLLVAGATERAPKSEFEARFKVFYAAYPKKKSPDRARTAFLKLKPDDAMLDSMLAAISRECQSAKWRENGGEFIPHPASWLNAGGWKDEGIDASRIAVTHSNGTNGHKPHVDNMELFKADPTGGWK